ncbi:MAG: enoyl-CoA hydratase/isomerase family protein [Chloroflexi bacterium]|nr:enoyl-CoA hydratase/isomerase family protein [Chloroflexota bacterium]
MTYTNLTYAKADGVATITLVHPPTNAISRAMLIELDQVLAAIEQDAATRAVLVTGSGERAFSAGADFREYASEEVEDFMRRGGELFTRIEHFPKPVLAAINGHAFGGGLELALACHLRFMVDSAELAFTEVTLGIMPGWGGTQRLPLLVGRARALEYLLTGDRWNAQDALIAGLVNRVYRGPELMESSRAFAQRLAAGAPLALSAILDAVVRGGELGIADGLHLEAAHALELGESEDAVIGVSAIVEGRLPRFIGR